MKPGHPFDTKERDKLRAKQRRWLAALRRRWAIQGERLEQMPRPDVAGMDAVDRALVEERIRKYCDDFAGRPPFAEYIAAVDVDVASIAVSRFFNVLPRGPAVEVISSDQRTEIVGDDGGPPSIGQRELFDLYAFVLLLVYADDLADDDFASLVPPAPQ